MSNVCGTCKHIHGKRGSCGAMTPTIGATPCGCLMPTPDRYVAQSGTLSNLIRVLRDHGVEPDHKGNGATPPMSKAEIIEFVTQAVDSAF